MKSARVNMYRVVDALAITEDAKAALREMYGAIEEDREIGIDCMPSVYKLSGVLAFLYKAQLIDDSEYEDLAMVANRFEDAGVKLTWWK